MGAGPLLAIRGLARRTRRAVRRAMRPHALVLNYHRIAVADGPDPWGLCVAPARFAEQLEVLRAHAEIVPLREAMARLRRRAARPVVALTFDDGYADDLAAALPALERSGSPATFFVATGLIGSNEPYWWDRLAAAAARAPLPFGWRADGRDWRFEGDRATALAALHLSLWTLDEAPRDAVLDALETSLALRAEDVGGRPLSTAGLGALARSPLVELGAHSMRHRHLPSLAHAPRAEEIAGSRRALEALCGRTVESFAYPYGAFDAATKAEVRDAGFRRACATTPELAWAGDDPFAIPRFAVGDWDGPAFERRLCWEWLP